MNLVRIIHKLSAVQDTVVRNEALQDARNFLQGRPYQDIKPADVELEFRKLWQGLFYYYWLTDKEMPQLEAAQSIASMMHLIGHDMSVIIWMKTFYITLTDTWTKLDKHRMSKYYSLVRFMVQQSFVFLNENKYDEKILHKFLVVMKQGPLLEDTGLLISLRIHITQMFLLELKQFGSENITEKALHELIRIFLNKLAFTKEESMLRTICEDLLHPLSEELDIQLENVDDLEEGDELVTLPVNFKTISDYLLKLAQNKKCENTEDCYAWKKVFDSKIKQSADDILAQQEAELEQLQDDENDSSDNEEEEEEDDHVVTPSARKLIKGDTTNENDSDDDQDDDDSWVDIGDIDQEDDDDSWYDQVDDEDDDEYSYNDLLASGLYDDDEDEDDFDDQENDYGEDEQLINMDALIRRIALGKKKKLLRDKLDQLLLNKETVPEQEIVQAIHKAVAPMDVKVVTVEKVTSPTDSDKGAQTKRNVNFGNNQVKLFEKTTVVEKKPISGESPKKGLLKKRLSSEVDKPKNPPITTTQNAKKKRKKN